MKYRGWAIPIKVESILLKVQSLSIGELILKLNMNG